MKKLFVFIFCFVFGASVVSAVRGLYFSTPKTVSQSQKPQESEIKFVADPDYEFYGIEILDSGKVWAVGDKRLHFSDDFGRTWQSSRRVFEVWTLHEIEFVDDRNGWASGRNQILRTVDGGANWHLRNFNTKAEFDSLSFYNEKIGYVGGGALTKDCRGCDFYHIPVEIWKTTDGGDSWKRIFRSTKYYSVFNILAVTEDIAIVIFNGENILRTEDGGKTWTQVAEYPHVEGMTIAPDGKIWTVGNWGNFYFSDDKGLTWKRPPNLPAEFLSYSWNDIAFADSERGIAIGNDAKVAITKDGGISWKEILNPSFVKGSFLDNLSWVKFRGDMGIVIGQNGTYRFAFPKD